MSKQDRQGARTVSELERRYKLGNIPSAVESARVAQKAAEEAKSAADDARKIVGALSALLNTNDEGVLFFSGSSIYGGVIKSVDGTSIVIDLDSGTISVPLLAEYEAVSAQASYTAMLTDTLIDGTLTKDKISNWYTLNLWTETMIQSAVEKGVLTTDEAEEILRRGEML